jgi:hypothetical protein
MSVHGKRRLGVNGDFNFGLSRFDRLVGHEL